MDRTATQARNASRPALVIVAAAYCLLLTAKIGYWLVAEGWGLARTGDIALMLLIPPALTSILLAAGGLLLWARSAKSSWCLLGALLLGLTLAPIMTPEVFRVSASMYVKVVWYVLPAIIHAGLLISVWIYSLRLRRTGYFK